MGSLLFNDTGRILPAEAEPVTRWRSARKQFRLDGQAASDRARLWLCLGEWTGNDSELHVLVNGKRAARVGPSRRRGAGPARPNWMWHDLELGTDVLRAGVNDVTLRGSADAMIGWMVGLDCSVGGTRRSTSSVSDDGGRTWRTGGMGLHSQSTGEYVARLRTRLTRPPSPQTPAIRYENARHPKVRSLVDFLPAAVRRSSDPRQQLLRLRSWIARQWGHVPRAGHYAPWDPATVLEWSRKASSGSMPVPITLCVHYGAAFAAFATALGHCARCVATARSRSSWDGHFVAEVWDRDLRRWVMHDPNLDLHFETVDGRLLSTADVCDRVHAGESLRTLARLGPSAPVAPRRLTRFLHGRAVEGTPFRCIGLWTRNDYVSNPQVAPPHHGAMCYSETDFLWYSPVPTDEWDMFPHVTSDRMLLDRR